MIFRVDAGFCVPIFSIVNTFSCFNMISRTVTCAENDNKTYFAD